MLGIQIHICHYVFPGAFMRNVTPLSLNQPLAPSFRSALTALQRLPLSVLNKLITAPYLMVCYVERVVDPPVRRGENSD